MHDGEFMAPPNRLATWGRPGRRASWRLPPRSAAVASPSWARPCTACCGPRRCIARAPIGNAEGEPPDCTGWYGKGRPGPAIKVALLGDSSAAGYGVEAVQETPGAHLASGLAEGADRRVYLRSVAFVGAQTRDLSRQIDKALAIEPHVAVILVGANDVTHSRLPSESVRLLARRVRRLRDAGAEVVVGTCPDLGTIEPIAPPLRQVARLWSRRLAAAQTIATVEAGGRTVSLGLGARPGVRGHPRAVLRSGPVPPVRGRLLQPRLGAAALACSPPSASSPSRTWCPRPPAARRSCRSPRPPSRPPAPRAPRSTAPRSAGATRGTRGRWVQLRRRRRQPEPDVEAPDRAPSRRPRPDAEWRIRTRRDPPSGRIRTRHARRASHPHLAPRPYAHRAPAASTRSATPTRLGRTHDGPRRTRYGVPAAQTHDVSTDRLPAGRAVPGP